MLRIDRHSILEFKSKKLIINTLKITRLFFPPYHHLAPFTYSTTSLSKND